MRPLHALLLTIPVMLGNILSRPHTTDDPAVADRVPSPSPGEKFSGSGDAATAAAAAAIRGAGGEGAGGARSSEKAAKKAAFDSEYDVGARAASSFGRPPGVSR